MVHIAKGIALNRWTWLAVALVGALAALYVYASSRQQQEIRAIVLAAADEEAMYMLRNLSGRLKFIASDLLDFSARSPHHSQSDHLAGTTHLIDANPFLQAINHVGADRRIQYVAPFEPNKHVVGLKIEIPAPEEALEMAVSLQRPYLSRPFEIVQGMAGYAMMVPDIDGRFFEIVFRAEAVFGSQGSFRHGSDIVIQAFDAGVLVFEDADYEDKLSETSRYKVSVEAALLNRSLRIDVLPGDALLARSSAIWRTVATGSLVLSFVSLSAIAATQAFNIRRRQRSEERTRRLLRENEVLAEIGRIITSSLDIEEVYERFAEQVGRLVPFDGIAINLVEPDGVTAVAGYMLGERLERHWEQGRAFDLAGTITQQVVERRRGTVFSADDEGKMADRYRGGYVAFQAGFRSFAVVPLVSGGESIGALLLLSAERNAYTEQDLAVAERVGAQIAGAIANARLHTDVQRSEERTRGLSRENEVLAEIGRTITSSVDIEEVYEHFGEQVRKLIPFDGIAIDLVETDGAAGVNTYLRGEILERYSKLRGRFDLGGTITQEVVEKRRGVVSSFDGEDEVLDRYPNYPSGLMALRLSYRSSAVVPLISAGECIGVLALFSVKSNAYTEQDLAVAERVGAQIAGAIANARLHTDVQRSEERTRRLPHENEVLAEIGRTITSSLDIDEVYDRFGEQVRELIPFDRIDIVSVDLERNEMRVEYVHGIELDAPTTRRGYTRPLKGSIVEEVVRRGTGILSVPRPPRRADAG